MIRFSALLPISAPFQGRNEVYGIRDQRPKKGWDQGSQPRIRDQSPRDRDQRVFHFGDEKKYLVTTLPFRISAPLQMCFC